MTRLRWDHPSTQHLTEPVRRRLFRHLVGELPQVPVTLASSVLVLRDHPSEGLQVLLQRRAPDLSYAPGVKVFPGGRVDPGDGEPLPGWAGPSPTLWVEVLQLATVREATGVLRAAVRETAEECGVQLGRGQGRLDTSLLRYWSTWVTPAWSPRRYRTVFLAARLPPGEVARTASPESTSTRWVRPADASGSAASMMLATRATLHELAAHQTVAAALANPPEHGPRETRAEVVDGQVRLVVDTPEGPMTRDEYLSTL